MPIRDASLFVFETSKTPEAVLRLDRAGGILIACDSLQNWVEVDSYFSEESAKQMTAFGFIKPANVGPGWVRYCDPQASDFSRLKDVSFRHLLSAHGRPLRDEAPCAALRYLRRTIQRLATHTCMSGSCASPRHMCA